ncbi:MAG: methionyl-tRNA formyltransferase, partial [Candidatus Binatia bacterium]
LEGRVQDEAIATHDPLCHDEHAAIDWSRPTQELHDLIRGCDPVPGAHTRWNDVRVRLYGSRRGAGRPEGAPGTVVVVDEEGIEVATGDGSLRFAKMVAGGKKAPAAEAAAEAGIRPGACLRSGPDG